MDRSCPAAAIYYQALRIAASENVAFFKREIVRVLGESRMLDSLHDWLGVLTYLEDALPGRLHG